MDEPTERVPIRPDAPLLTFEEARRWHAEEFGKLTPQQRMEWPGQMLEIMELSHASKPPSPATPPRYSRADD